ncbi:MAG: ethanolamine utilization protein EutN [Bacteroidetes bacterium]|nr:MAG: ethanolamine utilization protein EutN [Bacteroidota bacterium]
MHLAKVEGKVVSTKKNDSIEGAKYLLVNLILPNGGVKDKYIIALDLVGAGEGEVVVIAQGSSSRQTDITKNKPIDAVIIGIVDLIEIKGNVVFKK